MRISKPPEERRQEIIDTAMIVFAEKGYEATSVSDIAKRMNVVSGLFYKYFSSKEELFHIALEQYAGQFANPIINALKKYDTIEEFKQMMHVGIFFGGSKEQYHNFFHGRGNEMFHQQLNHAIATQIIPHVSKVIEGMIQRYNLNISDAHSTAEFLVFGFTPIFDDENLDCEQKYKIILELFDKVIC